MNKQYSVSLYFKQRGSDKAYHAYIEKEDEINDLWTVRGVYGPSWNACVEAIKCKNSSFDVAVKNYYNVIKSKLRKGYTTKIEGFGGNGIDELVAATEDLRLHEIYKKEFDAAAKSPKKRMSI
jgi:hypothetical protein